MDGVGRSMLRPYEKQDVVFGWMVCALGEIKNPQNRPGWGSKGKKEERIELGFSPVDEGAYDQGDSASSQNNG